MLITGLPTIDVVIAALNEERSIGACLDALKSQDYPQHLLTLYVVLDQRNSDRTGEIAESYSVTVRQAEGSGVPYVRNFGSRLGNGELIAFLDAHCFAERNWALAMARAFDDESVGGCQGSIDDVCDDEQLRRLVACSPTASEQRLAEHTVEARTSPLPWIIGGNSVFRRSALQSVATPGQSLCEDLEISWELVLRGYQLRYAPAAKVVHQNYSSAKSYLKRSYLQGKVAAQLGYIYGFPWTRSRKRRYNLNLETFKLDALYDAGFFVESLRQRFGAVNLRQRRLETVQSRFRRSFAWTSNLSLQISQHHVFWMIGNDPCVVDLRTRMRTVLDGTAGDIFKQLIAGSSRNQTCSIIAEKYSIDVSAIESDVDDFVDTLSREGLLVRHKHRSLANSHA